MIGERRLDPKDVAQGSVQRPELVRDMALFVLDTVVLSIHVVAMLGAAIDYAHTKDRLLLFETDQDLAKIGPLKISETKVARTIFGGKHALAVLLDIRGFHQSHEGALSG